MPLTVPAGLLTKANFIVAHLKPLLDAVETTATSAASVAAAASTTASQKYTKPGTGIPLSDLSTAALAGLVQTDGTVLRAVRLTQAQYDALGTKVATTAYFIVG